MTDMLYRGKAINRNPNQSYRTTYQNGDWVYGLVSRLNEYFTEMTNEDGVSGIDVDRDTICIGTKINGIAFYTGDIVEISATLDGKEKAYGEIKFGEFLDYHENTFTGFYIQWHGRYYQEYRKSIKWWLTERDLKIVGNIYDNSELLKGGKQMTIEELKKEIYNKMLECGAQSTSVQFGDISINKVATSNEINPYWKGKEVAFNETLQLLESLDDYIKAPCKLGDTVYTIGEKIDEWEVFGILIQDLGIFLKIFDKKSCVCQMTGIKSVFFSKEKAEQRFAEIKGE